MKKRRLTNLLWGIAFAVAFWLIWSKLRIIVWVPMSPWMLLGVMAVLAVAIFLVLDHLFNRSD